MKRMQRINFGISKDKCHAVDKGQSTSERLVLDAMPCRTGNYENMGFEYWDILPSEISPLDVVISKISEIEFNKMLDTLKGALITLGHTFVGRDDRDDIVGHLGDELEVVNKDGDLYAKQKAYLTDSRGISAFTVGEKELSIGFTCYADWVGDSSGYIDLTDIEINHVAIVERGRAGNQAKLFEKNFNKNEGLNMKIEIGGNSFEVAEDVGKAFIAYSTENKATNSKVAELQTEVGELKAKHSEALKLAEKVKTEYSESNLDSLVAKRLAFIDGVKKLDKNVTIENRANDDIIKEVLHNRGIEADNENERAGAFKALLATASNSETKAKETTENTKTVPKVVLGKGYVTEVIL